MAQNSDNVGGNDGGNDDRAELDPNTFNMNYLKIIPHFDGDSANLTDFINACDLIVDNYYDATLPTVFRNKLIIISIKNHLKGPAKQLISTRSFDTWALIKACLISNFGDQRDTESLFRDLHHMHQTATETPKQFGQRIIAHTVLLMQSIENHDDDVLVVQSKRDSINNQGLKTFLAGLHEPLGSNIRGRDPSSIQDALRHILNEENITYMKQRLGMPTQQNVIFNKSQFPTVSKQKYCTFCKCPGHLINECRKRTMFQSNPTRNWQYSNPQNDQKYSSVNPNLPRNFTSSNQNSQNFGYKNLQHNTTQGASQQQNPNLQFNKNTYQRPFPQQQNQFKAATQPHVPNYPNYRNDMRPTQSQRVINNLELRDENLQEHLSSENYGNCYDFPEQLENSICENDNDHETQNEFIQVNSLNFQGECIEGQMQFEAQEPNLQFFN